MQRWSHRIWPASVEKLMDCQVSHISSFREEVEVLLPYQSVLQRLQLPLDCLTFFINSQVILFPWQQFPADTKNQVSPWKFKSVVGSLSVFICVELHHHFQQKLQFSCQILTFIFIRCPALPCIQVMISSYLLIFTTSDQSVHCWESTAQASAT